MLTPCTLETLISAFCFPALAPLSRVSHKFVGFILSWSFHCSSVVWLFWFKMFVTILWLPTSSSTTLPGTFQSTCGLRSRSIPVWSHLDLHSLLPLLSASTFRTSSSEYRCYLTLPNYNQISWLALGLWKNHVFWHTVWAICPGFSIT